VALNLVKKIKKFEDQNLSKLLPKKFIEQLKKIHKENDSE
jgi:hypothetical protein